MFDYPSFFTGMVVGITFGWLVLWFVERIQWSHWRKRHSFMKKIVSDDNQEEEQPKVKTGPWSVM